MPMDGITLCFETYGHLVQLDIRTGSIYHVNVIYSLGGGQGHKHKNIISRIPAHRLKSALGPMDIFKWTVITANVFGEVYCKNFT